jgi:hypothetical protein
VNKNAFGNTATLRIAGSVASFSHARWRRRNLDFEYAEMLPGSGTKVNGLDYLPTGC